MPEQLEHVDSIQGRVEQEVVDCLDALLLWFCHLYSAAQHFGQTDEGLDVSTIACTFAQSCFTRGHQQQFGSLSMQTTQI